MGGGRGGGRVLSGYGTGFTKYMPSESPFFSNFGLTLFVLEIVTISVVDMVADE